MKVKIYSEDVRHFAGIVLFFLSFLWFSMFPYAMFWLLPNDVVTMAAIGIASMWLIGFGFLFCAGLAVLLSD